MIGLFDALIRMRLTLALIALLVPLPLFAQDASFAPGWQIDAQSSQLRFQSVKNVTKVESSTFAAFSGGLSADGTLSLHVFLDSVDTKIDLRNVRMRFLLFETFRFPEAVITAKINAADLADLPTLRRKTIHLTYTLDLHGVKKELETDVAVTMVQDDTVVVSSTTPVVIATDDFGLADGVQKLQEAANVVIIPSGTISFDLTLKRNGGGVTPAAPAPAETAPVADVPVVAATPQAPAAEVAAPDPVIPAVVAQEPTGDLDLEACKGRFEILSRSGNINFHSGSARLQADSAPLLDSVADIVSRCPGLKIEVSGHTDADGTPAANQYLSQQRAKAVVRYLVNKGLTADRFTATGYGEDKPIFDNETPEHKSRNRRIEFALVQQ
ncbi:OmpA family protein [Cypionkella sp.]|uniref:OmpA family protein n=1 Tax=Cypionkella sp. TaxID=2811411 RepID=UPI00271E0BD0|nr:OmpA family protein [Cypionkella sp.]MDO8982474.1 OmpA family protein [Cypionkella sp.]MDP2050477.1 OmpA family protein [Cypionkella sp.]